MITHEELFNRAMAENDYGAVMTIEDAVEQDLDEAYTEYQKAVAAWELTNARHIADNSNRYDYDLDLAYITMQEKYIEYLKKNMIHSAFHGYYKTC